MPPNGKVSLGTFLLHEVLQVIHFATIATRHFLDMTQRNITLATCLVIFLSCGQLKLA